MLRELFEPGPGRQPVILALPWWQVDVGGLWTVGVRKGPLWLLNAMHMPKCMHVLTLRNMNE